MKAIKKLQEMSRRLPSKKGRPLCPRIKATAFFWRHLIEWLDGDIGFLTHAVVTPAVVKKYNRNIWAKVEKFFETAADGCPSNIAATLFEDKSSTFPWLKKIIENAPAGHPASVAMRLYDQKKVTKIWVKKIVENSAVGNPCDVAAKLCASYNFDVSWGKSIVSNCTFGDPSCGAIMFYKSDLVNPWWVKNVILNDKIGDPSTAALYLFDDQEVNRKWFKNIVEKDNSGDQSGASAIFVIGESIKGTILDGEIEWAEDIIGDGLGFWKKAAFDMVNNGLSSEEWFESLTGKDFQTFTFK